MRVVRERIDALRLLTFDEHLVGVDGVLVGLHGVVPASDADVDVRGHVDHVSFARHEPRESLGARHRGLRVHRLDGVDVIVARAGVVRVPGDDFPQLAHDLVRAGVRRAVRPPVVPRAKVHQRFGVQCRGVEIVRVGARDGCHGARVERVECRPIGRWVRRVALRDGFDVRALLRRSVRHQRTRALHRRVRGHAARGVHGRVDVRTVGEGDPPVAHGARGIELGRALERADRFRVIEPVDESQALVEVPLGGRDLGGDGLVVGAEVGVEGYRVGRARRLRARDRWPDARARSRTREQRSGEQDDAGERHGLPPLLSAGARVLLNRQ